MRRRVFALSLFAVPVAIGCAFVAEACGGAYGAANDEPAEASTPGDGGLIDARADALSDAADGDVAACQLAYGEGDGTLRASTVMCGGISVDVSASSRHCGACGHDCKTATCSRGRCDPEIAISTGPDEIVNVLGVSGDRAYWASVGGGTTPIRSHPLDGGTFSAFMAQPSASGGAFLGIFTPTRAFVYWKGGPVLEKPLDSSTNAILVVPGDPSGIAVTHMAASTTHLYYGDSSLNVVRRVPATGGAEESLASSFELTGMAADDDAAYWTGGTSPDAGRAGPGSVTRYDAKTGSITRSPPSGHPRALAIDGTYAYAVDADDGAFRRFEKSDLQRPSTKLAAWKGRLNGIRYMTVTGGFIYAQIDVGDLSELVIRVPVCGGAPLVIADAKQTAPFAVDATYVYVGASAGVARVGR